MTRILSLIVLALASFTTSAMADTDALFTPEVFKALAAQESRGEKNPDAAVGDNGASLGRYQIQYAYWVDAVEKNPGLKARGYEAVKDPRYAEEIIKAYARRWAPKGATLQDVIRIHNGGPKGYLRSSTEAYWKQFKARLDRIMRGRQ